MLDEMRPPVKSGTVTVAAGTNGTLGVIKFTKAGDAGTVLMDFPVAGQTISISQGGTTFFTGQLAEAIAPEWAAVPEKAEINAAHLPLTRLAATGIDRVVARRADVIADTAKYAGSDLLCYRATAPDSMAPPPPNARIGPNSCTPPPPEPPTSGKHVALP